MTTIVKHTCVLLFATLFATTALAQEDVGDHGLRNASRPEAGVLFGGQPTAEQLEQMAADGVALVLDLRAEGEDRGFDEAAALSDLDVEYINLPVDRERLEMPETFERFIEAMDQAERPVLVHCASGNRVGALYYAYLVAGRGEDRDEARALARDNGLKNRALEGAVDRWLDSRSEQ